MYGLFLGLDLLDLGSVIAANGTAALANLLYIIQNLGREGRGGAASFDIGARSIYSPVGLIRQLCVTVCSGAPMFCGTGNMVPIDYRDRHRS